MSQMKHIPNKVLLVGSLFGSRKVQTEPDLTPYDEYFFAEQLAFRNTVLLDAAREIVQRIGGLDSFVGVHARIAEYQFRSKARGNMLWAWQLLTTQMGITSETKMKALKILQVRRKQRNRKDGKVIPLIPAGEEHVKGKLDVPPPTFAPPTLNGLTCRGALHTDPSLALFNVPLYLATDARFPEDDPDLDIFFVTFPCTFILSDFENGNEPLARLQKLVNVHDGVKLGRLLIPFLEATVAAMGVITTGTKGSTFSAFASWALHDAYRKNRPF